MARTTSRSPSRPVYKQNKSGYYRATFQIINAQGKKQRIEVYDTDPVLLERKLMEKKFEYERGLLIVNGNSSVEKWALEWLETYKKGKVGQGAYDDYKQKINTRILPAIGNMRLEDIKHHHLQSILNKEIGSKSNAKKVKNTIEQIFQAASVNGLINRNPAIGLELPKLEDGKRRSITPEERKIILEVAKTHRTGLWIKIMLYCGLRPSEAIVLTGNDINIKNKTISVNKSLELKTGKVKTTKTPAGIRTVPIPDILINDLKDIPLSTDLLFKQMTTGKMHTATSINSMWKNFVREMNIALGAKMYRNQIKKEDSLVAEDLTPYCLRHTYCTDLQDAGVPINVAKYLMGHSDIRVTANIYTHHSEKVSADAIKAINKHQSNI